MVVLSEQARALLESPALAHAVTINPDGSPQVAIVWIGLDGDEIVMGHLDANQRKLRNLRRDPRISLSIETDTINPYGLREYLVIHGRARLTEGGAAELLQRLARTYIGPDVRFPPIDDPPPGIVVHIRVDKVGGVGDWTVG
jgi:PPOX class probable F420-dependent enzyme